MAKYTPPSSREHPPYGPMTKGGSCIGGVHSPGPATNVNTSAASNGSQPVTRDQPSMKAPPKK